MGAATAAQILAEHTSGVNPDTAFLIGLFLNIGLFAYANLFPEQFDAAKLEAKSKRIHLNTVLHETLLLEVRDITLKVANQWQLPRNIIDSIKDQDLIADKKQDPSIQISPLTAIGHLSQMATDVFFGTSSLVS
jgi:HD-like signal output (HDOD) protein